MDKIITYSFCDSFIEKLVGYLREEYIEKGKDLSRLAVVFGGKRPAMFVKRDLARYFKRGFYPPRFFTIDEWMAYTVRQTEPFVPAQDLDNCFLLYQLAKDVAPEILKGRDTFDQFLPWTREILRFIDQLDLEDIDSRALKSIQLNARIGYDVPEDINRLLQSIVGLRTVYHRELMKDKRYSRGLQYWRAARLAQDRAFDEFDKILFCNFFYFHRTEETLIKHLYQRDKAVLIFQGDQRRWPVLDRISKMFSCVIEEGDQPRPPEFALNLHAGFDVHSQVGLVREILKKTQPHANTVIVLPDPGHLIPLLSEVNSLIGDFNISMGYPLKRSSLYMLFEFIFKAQLSRREGRYYTKDYLKALRHPFIKNLSWGGDDPAVTRVLVHRIEEILTGQERTPVSGSVFIRLEDLVGLEDLYFLTSQTLTRLGLDVGRPRLKAILEGIHGLLFSRWELISHFQDFAGALGQFLDVMVEKSSLEQYPLNLNIAAKIFAIRDEFDQAAFARECFDKEEIFRIFDHKISHELIAFSGSPLKGVQVLGMLETRSLNFDHVIILDVNEGALPNLRVHEPLIPREVMIQLGLDRLELEEEIQRYQFMRLISSAKRVDLVYQESKDKERSRFVEELIWEEQKQGSSLSGVTITRPSFRVSVKPQKMEVAKTGEMISLLKSHTFSASSLNMYLRNPMEFYVSYVLGLKEREDLLDEPEARQVGTFIHALLEEAFRPFLNKEPIVDAVFRGHFEKLFDRQFQEVFGRTMKSDAFLLRAVMTERLKQFLDYEQGSEERQVAKILFLEERFEDTISLPAGDFKFRYVVDRVDELKDGTVMILDYKTGGADIMPKPLEEILDLELSRESIRDHLRSFQIPLYFYYLDKQFPGNPINAALYYLKPLKLEKFIQEKSSADRKVLNDGFLRALNFIMAEILDPDVPFVEDE